MIKMFYRIGLNTGLDNDQFARKLGNKIFYIVHWMQEEKGKKLYLG